MDRITGLNYANQVCILVDENDEPVVMKTAYRTFRGDEWQVTGGRAPHKPSSQGKVWVEDWAGFTMEYYPSVFGMRWATEVL
jgi:hypothetical protein